MLVSPKLSLKWSRYGVVFEFGGTSEGNILVRRAFTFTLGSEDEIDVGQIETKYDTASSIRGGAERNFCIGKPVPM